MSEKILFGELGAGEIVTVDVEGWDGESKDTDGAKFTFAPRPKPLPEGQFSELSVEAAEAVKDVDSASDGDVPETDRITDEELDRIIDEGERISSNETPTYGSGSFGNPDSEGESGEQGPQPGGQPQQ